MIPKNWLLIVLVSTALLAACGGRPATVNLGVDLYIHPDSASPNDVILQAAIGENLREAIDDALIHVRVFERTAYLSGAVKSDEARQEAQRIAEATRVTLTDGAGNPKPAPLRAERVDNRVRVESKN